MAPRKKYTTLNMQQRLDVLKDLRETGLSTKQIGKKYGVGIKTIHRILRDATKIDAFADKSKCELKRRRIVKPQYDEIDKELLSWFIQRRTLGDRITDALILEKATELKENLPSCSRFKVSSGWLSKFKKRHGIRLVKMYGEKASTDQDGADAFIYNFKKIIEEGNASMENMYNVDENGLVWKTLPTKTLVGEEEKNLSGHKANITGEQCPPAHVAQFLLNCEEGGRRNENEEMEELKEEPQDEPQEMTFDNNEIVNNELRVLIEGITSHTATAPPYVKCLAQGLKLYFLSKEYQIRNRGKPSP
nr:jerky protein homolog-like [Megalopta genalis]